MARFIVTGRYTAAGAKGMMANPIHRLDNVKPLIAACGGTVESYFITMGESDFQMVVTGADPEGMIAGLLVAAGSGAVSDLKTVQAFSSEEFLAAQKRAGTIAGTYKGPA